MRRAATPQSAKAWHVTLLRVSCEDMLWAADRAGQEGELQAQTQRGEELIGRATIVDRRSAVDSLLLLGVSSLRIG